MGEAPGTVVNRALERLAAASQGLLALESVTAAQSVGASEGATATTVTLVFTDARDAQGRVQQAHRAHAVYR